MTKFPAMQLFDLSKDPGEENNLIAAHPERVEKMKGMLKELIDNGRTTPGPVLKNDVEKIVMVKPIPAPRKKKKPAAKK